MNKRLFKDVFNVGKNKFFGRNSNQLLDSRNMMVRLSIAFLAFTFTTQCGVSLKDYAVAKEAKDGVIDDVALASVCKESLENEDCKPVVVSFDFNEPTTTEGTNLQNKVTKIGGSVTLPDLTGVSKSGYVFLGWSTSKKPIATDWVSAGTEYTITGNIETNINVSVSTLKFYATWGQPYVIKYNYGPNNGANTNETPSVTDPVLYPAGGSATIFTNPEPNKLPPSAVGFFGWGVNPDGTGSFSYKENQAVIFSGNINLYALWYYPVKYDCNSGVSIGIGNFFAQWSRMRTGQNLLALPNSNACKKSNYVQVGWSPTGKSPVLTSMPNHSVGLKAVWEEVSYTIIYNSNGGKKIETGGPQSYSGPVSIPSDTGITPPENAIGFFGWASNPKGTGTVYTPKETMVFPHDSKTNLYAIWEYPISYDCNGGTSTGYYSSWALKKARVGKDMTYELPALGCHKENYVQKGWSLTGSLPVTTVMPNGPLNLKAIWSYIGVDEDGDGLIDINSVERLNAMRYNLKGTSLKMSQGDAGETKGCPSAGCHGYELTTSIDFATTKWGNSPAYTSSDKVSAGWEPIPDFSTTFDGNGFVIRNLYIDKSSSDVSVGFFGSTLDGAILNQVDLESVKLLPGSRYKGIGALVGAMRGGRITNSRTTGSIFNESFQGVGPVGGLVGDMSAGNMINSYTDISISVHATGGGVGERAGNVGGLVGGLGGASIINCYAMGAVSADTGVGGLVGSMWSGTIKNSYAMVAVSGWDYLAGLVAIQYGSSKVIDSYATGSVLIHYGFRGGIVSSQGGMYVNKVIVDPTVVNTYWDTTTSKQYGHKNGTMGLSTQDMQSPESPIRNLGPCFKFEKGKYPKLYTWDGSACTTDLVFGPNSL